MKTQTLKLARELGRRGHQRPSLLMPCSTTGQLLRVESRLERLIALTLDVDPRVTNIAAQPFTIRLDTAKIYETQELARASVVDLPIEMRKGLVYTPDFWLELVGGAHVIVECKPKDKTQELSADLERIRSVLEGMGLRFLVIADEHVGYPSLEGNLIRIRDANNRFRMHAGNFDFSWIETLTESAVQISLGEVLEVSDHETMLAAIASGVIAVDLCAGPLSKWTLATRSYGDLSHLQILDLEH
jgi:hypothetical protein